MRFPLLNPFAALERPAFERAATSGVSAARAGQFWSRKLATLPAAFRAIKNSWLNTCHRNTPATPALLSYQWQDSAGKQHPGASPWLAGGNF